MIEWVLPILAFVLPLLTGFILARKKPDWGPFRISFLSSLPIGIIFFVGAILVRLSIEAPACAEPPCANPAPLYFWALLIWGIIALLCGFGLGMVGHALGAKKRAKAAEDE